MAQAASYKKGRTPTIAAFKGAIAVFVTELRDETLVTIEGTHDALGWGIDFWAVLTRVKVARPINGHLSLPAAHKGFTEATDEIIDSVRLRIEGRKWHAIGHSQGGGVVLELAARLADEGHSPEAIWLFAPARVFLDAPDVLSDVPIHAWRCGGDIVPMVPPWCWRPIMKHLPGPSDETSHGIENFVHQLA